MNILKWGNYFGGSMQVMANESENIRVYLRIRPFIEREEEINTARRSDILQITADPSSGIPDTISIIPSSILANSVNNLNSNGNSNSNVNRPPIESFQYDWIANPQTTQEELFQVVAIPVTEYCLQGYNGTIFAYGQTGSGKTFTMQGLSSELLSSSSISLDDDLDPISIESLGVIPRTFDYLFQRIEELTASSNLAFKVKCNFVEIYNECIYDLLADESTSDSEVYLREDSRKGGVYVENCREPTIICPKDALRIFQYGSLNRHVAETSMNRASSRSHSVFTLYIQSSNHKTNGMSDMVEIRNCKFNLVDLAGSERQQLTGTIGARLKEAGNINKSLLALSNVINALVEQSSTGRQRHIHYRDSKLTFLLRESLGGNAKTSIIANVSPSATCQSETISTLRFAQRAKLIKNRAIVNQDIQGQGNDDIIHQLQAEIKRLQEELDSRDILDIPTNPINISPNLQSQSFHSSIFPPTCNNNSNGGNGNGSSGSSSNNDSEELIKLSLTRQLELEREKNLFQEQLSTLEEVLRRKDQQIQNDKMILKFRDSTIKSIQSKMESISIQKLQNQKEEDLESIKESETREMQEMQEMQKEILQQRQEIANLKQMIDNHPEVTKFAYENTFLRERIREIGGINDRLKQLQQHVDLLNKKLVSKEEIEGEKIKMELELELETKMKMELERNGKLESMIMDFQDKILVLQREKEESIQKLLMENKEISLSITKIRQDRENLQREMENSIEMHENVKTELLSRIEFQRQENQNLILRISNQSKDINAIRTVKEQLEETLMNHQIRFKDQELANRENLIKIENLKSINEKLELDTLEKMAKLANLEHRIEESDSKIIKLNEESIKNNEIINRQRKELESLSFKYSASISKMEEFEKALSRISLLELERESIVVAHRNAINTIQELYGNINGLEEKLRESQKCLAMIQRENSSLKIKESKLQFNIEGSHVDNEALLQKIQNLTMQLNTFQTDYQRLTVEIETLRGENDKLIQHSNLKQKLQYHIKIKQENNDLKEELRIVKEESVKKEIKMIDLEDYISRLQHLMESEMGKERSIKIIDKIMHK